MMATFLKFSPPEIVQNTGVLFMSVLRYYGRFFNPQMFIIDFEKYLLSFLHCQATSSLHFGQAAGTTPRFTGLKDIRP